MSVRITNLVFSLTLLLGVTAAAPARTITLTAQDCDAMACISAATPQLSWSMRRVTPLVATSHYLDFGPGMALLLRFPLERIPRDQRILRVEFTMFCNYVSGTPKVQFRRLLADWGPGVNHQYCRMFPTKVLWSQPGGRGVADRVPRYTGMFELKATKSSTVELTQDVDLWYTGAAPNRGWILNLENDQGITYLPAPYWPHAPTAKSWKLQITHEPL